MRRFDSVCTDTRIDQTQVTYVLLWPETRPKPQKTEQKWWFGLVRADSGFQLSSLLSFPLHNKSSRNRMPWMDLEIACDKDGSWDGLDRELRNVVDVHRRQGASGTGDEEALWPPISLRSRQPWRRDTETPKGDPSKRVALRRTHTSLVEWLQMRKTIELNFEWDLLLAAAGA